MIVADVNVLVYLLTDTPQRSLAKALYERDSDWRLPPLWRHELVNVLATLTRNGVIDPQPARQAWRNAFHLFAAGERELDLEEALSLAMESGISAYDAQYVALAQALDTWLVSEDQRLQRSFPNRVASLGQAIEP